MTEVLLLSLAGACGALARYWLSNAVYAAAGQSMPWGTWAVNILGCFLFGLVWTLATERGLFSTQARAIILAGFTGSFTTFSTLIFESGELAHNGAWLKLGLNVAGQNVSGFAAMYAGMACGRIF